MTFEFIWVIAACLHSLRWAHIMLLQYRYHQALLYLPPVLPSWLCAEEKTEFKLPGFTIQIMDKRTESN